LLVRRRSIGETVIILKFHKRRSCRMSTTDAATLVNMIDKEITELGIVCEGIDEQTAGRAPEGRWSPKQILSHLCGPEGKGMMASISAFFEQDMPRIDIVTEDPFFSENRANMTLAQLMSEVELEYSRVAGFASALDEKHLSRKAHIPSMKDSAIGEYPTLGAWIELIAVGHISFHLSHLKEILEQLGK
jgi:hypothetical protein